MCVVWCVLVDVVVVVVTEVVGHFGYYVFGVQIMWQMWFARNYAEELKLYTPFSVWSRSLLAISLCDIMWCRSFEGIMLPHALVMLLTLILC